MEIDHQVAIVTGASRGIGRATALALSRRGARVGLVARTADDLRRVAAEIPGPTSIAVADVSDADAVDAAMATIREDLGDIDILVNNAGVGAYGAVLEEDADVHERLMRINYLGMVNPTRAVLPSMARRRRGHIVNVASVAGRLGAPFEAAYSASKFAVVGWSESLAAEMSAFDVSVTLVNPGPVDTGFTDARGVPFQRKYPRPLSPEKVAGAVLTSIEKNRFEQTLPRWLRSGIVVRALAAGAYRKGLLRDSAAASADLARRFELD
jgi:short-subunit dehydrogenase